MNQPRAVPYGYCYCGCGERAPNATKHYPTRGIAKGQPFMFVAGHQNRQDPERRFLRKVTIAPNGCWLWLGQIAPNGYGKFWVREEQNNIGAHRWAYEHWRGPIPGGLEPDHLCRVRHCANPWHLEVVTHKENSLRGKSPAAENARKTHCKRGHPLQGKNLLIVKTKQGKTRHCRVCVNERNREWMRNSYRKKKNKKPPGGSF